MGRSLLLLAAAFGVALPAAAQRTPEWPNFPHRPLPRDFPKFSTPPWTASFPTPKHIAPLPPRVIGSPIPDFVSADVPGPARGEFDVAPTTTLHLLYIENASVRDELKLTKEQISKVEAIAARWSSKPTEQRLENGLRPTSGLQLVTESRKALDEALTPAQRQRLKQIILRHREREHGLPAVVSTLAGELNLSAEQQQKFESLRGARAEALLEHLTSGERIPAVRRNVSRANDDFVAGVEGLLTAEQRARLKDLFGAPFAGQIKLREPVPVPVATASGKVYLTKLFGHYSVEAEFLTNESVQKELGMDREQVRRAKEFHVEWSKRVAEGLKTNPDAAEVLLAQDELVRKELDAILKAHQRIRFLSIMTQYRERVAGVAGACGHPEALKAMELHEDDIKKLREGDESWANWFVGRGRPSIAYRGVLGIAFTGQVTINNPLVELPKASGKPAAAGPLVDEKRVVFANYLIDNARRMKLGNDQLARLREIAEDAPKLREILHRELSNLPPPTVLMPSRALPEARALEAFRKSIFEQCNDVLTKDQQVQFGAELKRAFRDY